MRRRGRVALVASFSLSMLLGVGTTMHPAAAHPYTDYFDYRWYSPADLQGTKWVNLYIRSDVAGNFDNRVIDAAHTWDNIGTLVDFKYVSDADVGLGCGAGYNRNLVYFGPEDGPHGTLAETDWCVVLGANPPRMYNFNVKYDPTEPWYTGTAQVPPTNQYDFWAAIAHEFGHGLGWIDHFPENSFHCPDANFDPARETMCPFTRIGDTAHRSLATHDRHTFINAYGPPFPT